MEPQPPLPRPPGDERNLRRLRKEAAGRMGREEPVPADPITVYGGPPFVTRRWTLRGILMLVVAALAAIATAIWGYRRIAVPVYGGPPAPVYGGPPPPQPPPPAEPPK
jgi:hypothetical protein